MSFLYVRVYYGPADSFGSIGVHKPQFLIGLQDAVRKLGFRVDLVAVDHVNYCMIEMCGHEIFRCNIKQLQFNMTSHRDVVAQRAIDAVIQSSAKFRRASACLWIWSYVEAQIFRRGKYTMPDHWLKDITYTPFEDTDSCVECYKFLLSKKIEEDS
ncbi:unnamed protein product [Chrysodeixis includens]|uniref:Uncharacterized protein n=1 Tax=Chrysodeixis includens TaxID=689277 RepID=A0A9P0C768_CHRIL|nr:unnamed protein product [Chrysodeixis includens]